MSTFWEWLFGSREQSLPAAANECEPDTAAVEPPYGVADRPMPAGDDVELLLPISVGPFARDTLRFTSLHAPIYADYRLGNRSVFVELGLCGDAAGARRALATAKAETDAEFPEVPQTFVRRPDASCLRTVNSLGAFFAWTRDRYYFSAHAKGGEQDLDEFMAAFPY